MNIPVQIYQLDPSGVARMARYVQTQSESLTNFTLGDIAQSENGLKDLDMFVDQMLSQQFEGLWQFVRDYAEEHL